MSISELNGPGFYYIVGWMPTETENKQGWSTKIWDYEQSKTYRKSTIVAFELTSIGILFYSYLLIKS